MPVFLANALLTTGRAQFAPATGLTTAEQQQLTQVRAHIEPMKATDYITQPGALEANYWARVETGTDIRVGDDLQAITLLDGATAWPQDFQATAYWRVVLVREEPPILPARIIYLKRILSKGPS